MPRASLVAALLLLICLPAAAIVVPIGGDPDDFTTTDAFFSGVGKITITKTAGPVGCSGSLLSTGLHVLTAAHCVTTGGVLDASAATVEFPTLAGISVAAFYVNPLWTGALGTGDLAILELSSLAPLSVMRYGLFSGAVLAYDTVTLAGYGVSGVGMEDAGLYPFGTLRKGDNTVDAFWGLTDTFATDFDNGLEDNNLIGFLLTTPGVGLGLGTEEVNIAPGDSGGPMFHGSLILGVHSFGLCVAFPGNPGCDSPPDVDTFLNSSHGEGAGHTDVREHSAWFDSILIPEPGTWLLGGAGLLVILLGRRRVRGGNRG